MNEQVQNTRLREPDPQYITTGHFKTNDRTDMVVFSFTFLLVEITCIVPIPAEGTTTVPVYLKFKLKRGV